MFKAAAYRRKLIKKGDIIEVPTEIAKALQNCGTLSSKLPSTQLHRIFIQLLTFAVDFLISIFSIKNIFYQALLYV
jgi:hypothetical protein